MSKNLNTAKLDDEVCTPADLIDTVLEILGVKRFGLDPASNPRANVYRQGRAAHTVMLPKYRDATPWNPSDVTFADSLALDWRVWSGPVWLNPPYSRLPREPWLRKWLEEASEGVALVPVRTASAWWQDDAVDAQVVTCLRRRVTHQGHAQGAPFGQALLYTGPRWARWASAMLERNLGWTTTT